MEVVNTVGSVPTASQVNMLPAPEVLSVEQLANIISVSGLIRDFLSSIEKYAIDAILNHGVVIPGYKVVAKNGRRKIDNPELLAAEMIKAGYDEAAIYKAREVESLSELEKIVGKKKFAELFGKFVIKPDGGPELAPEGDKRQAIKIDVIASAQNDFAD